MASNAEESKRALEDVRNLRLSVTLYKRVCQAGEATYGFNLQRGSFSMGRAAYPSP
jgi:hypothetical protein